MYQRVFTLVLELVNNLRIVNARPTCGGQTSNKGVRVALDLVMANGNRQSYMILSGSNHPLTSRPSQHAFVPVIIAVAAHCAVYPMLHDP